MDEDELRRRTNPIIMVMERRKEEKEWNATEVMRILRKRAAKRMAAEAAITVDPAHNVKLNRLLMKIQH